MNDNVKKVLKMYSVFICVGCLLGVIISVAFSQPEIKTTEDKAPIQQDTEKAKTPKGNTKAP